jgi:hypothetical protein
VVVSRRIGRCGVQSPTYLTSLILTLLARHAEDLYVGLMDFLLASARSVGCICELGLLGLRGR